MVSSPRDTTMRRNRAGLFELALLARAGAKRRMTSLSSEVPLARTRALSRGDSTKISSAPKSPLSNELNATRASNASALNKSPMRILDSRTVAVSPTSTRPIEIGKPPRPVKAWLSSVVLAATNAWAPAAVATATTAAPTIMPIVRFSDDIRRVVLMRITGLAAPVQAGKFALQNSPFTALAARAQACASHHHLAKFGQADTGGSGDARQQRTGC